MRSPSGALSQRVSQLQLVVLSGLLIVSAVLVGGF
jgi:hypothetical protein